MHFARSSALISIGHLALRISALPQPQAYSVVNVDGGSGSSASPTTIYQTVTESSSSETTLSVTVVETSITTSPASDAGPAAPPSTTTILESGPTDTPIIEPTAIVPVVEPLTVSDSATVTLSVSPSSTPSTSPTQPTTFITKAAPTDDTDSTVTILSTTTTTATPSTSYYDNGMWHTSYAIKNAYETRSVQWNHTISDLPSRSYPTATGVHARRAAAPTGYASGGWLAARAAAPTGYASGALLGARAAATGDGTAANYARGVAPTGYAGQSWNETGRW